MVKRVTVLAMALAAVAALAVPAFASASKLTLDSAGTELVPAGTEIQGHSGTNRFAGGESLVTETELGTLNCEEITLSGKVGTNNGSKVLSEGITGTTSGCTLEGEPFTVSGIEISKLESTTSGTGTAAFKFTATFFGGSLVCTWSGTGTFTYTAGTSILKLGATALSPSPSVCGAASIKGNIALSLTSGAAVFAF
jgi:hypothetical protein